MLGNSQNKIQKSLPKNLGVLSATYYACECGKNYNNFPALYLHFQRKHNLKISTKTQLCHCSIETRGRHQIITYFYSHSVEKSEQNQLTQWERLPQQWLALIDQYVINYHHYFQTAQEQLQCLEALKQYVGSFSIEQVQSCESEKGKEFTFWFNNFLLQRRNRISSGEHWRWCETLIQFSKWQYEKNYSSIIIEQNEGYKY